MKIMRSQKYKTRLVAQGSSEIPSIDYKETYYPMVDAITLRLLISLSVYENLDMYLMNVVTTYLYGSLDNDIYMKVTEGYKISETYKSIS